MPHLPSDFIRKIERLLGPSTAEFLASYEQRRTYGLRLNPLKVQDISRTDFMPRSLQPLNPVPWCRGGYYYEESARPGKHPYHAAGVYYIQEPSAMSAAELLSPEPGDIVLDLAAAPGGKATQIAGLLQGSGLLIANEVHPARAKVLAGNIERMGVRNAVVTNEDPKRLAERFPAFFDRILLDAPCSGEGMFRKDPDTIREWSPEIVAMCANRQREILAQAVLMLKPGGILAYSTCTFSPEENEENVDWVMRRYPEFQLLRCERFWPHTHQGEGHFVAILQKRDSASSGKPDGARAPFRPNAKNKSSAAPKALAEAMRHFREFIPDGLPGFQPGPGEPVLFGEQLYWLPRAEGCPFSAEYLRGLKVIRPGLHLGTLRKNRLEPAHALALAAHPSEARNLLRFHAGDGLVFAYLRGETLPAAPRLAGWTLVTVDDFPLGWGKAGGGQLKNHYPKGIRWTDTAFEL